MNLRARARVPGTGGRRWAPVNDSLRRLPHRRHSCHVRLSAKANDGEASEIANGEPREYDCQKRTCRDRTCQGRVTIPAEIRQAARLEEGDEVDVEIVEDGILLRPMMMIDASHRPSVRVWRSGCRSRVVRLS